MPEERLLIVGTGAMACLFGARLASRAEVTLLGGWRDGLRALERAGIRLDVDGTSTRARVRVTSDPGECRGVSLALVLVKSWQTERAAAQLASCLSEGGVALTLQNGLGNLEQLQAALGHERAALGVTTVGATLVGPAHVRLGGMGPTHLAQHPRLEPLASLLQEAGFEVRLAQDLESLVWGKLAVNAGINPLTALQQMENGGVLEQAEARALAAAAAQEVAAVAAARGTRMPFPDPGEETLAVARRTAHNRSSMYQDILRGAPTEVDAICGAVVREGQRLGVPTRVNWTLWQMVRVLAARREEAVG
jgi:2-dehydropantoate 2-reductase